MELTQAINIVSEYQKWRRGEKPYGWSKRPQDKVLFPHSQKELGLAIDLLLEAVQAMVQK